MQAAEIIEGGEQCFVANIVLCELVWVLRNKPYQFSREEISNTIDLMLQCGSISVLQIYQMRKKILAPSP
nr:hypothetical protein [Nostoc sp. WHI]